MSHLSADRLAELGDDTPTPAETSHLDHCGACAGERHAYVALVDMARAERATIGVPLAAWEAIAAGLASPVHVPPLDAPAPVHVMRRDRWRPLQVAAGLLLLVGGAMLGRMSAGAAAFPARAVAAATLGAREGPWSRTVDANAFGSLDEARAAQERSRRVFEDAAAYLARHDSTTGDGSPVAYRSRLAALDQVISTTREALREAPHDPVMNDYYLTTIGQREATLRQLNTALPASLRLNSF